MESLGPDVDNTREKTVIDKIATFNRELFGDSVVIIDDTKGRAVILTPTEITTQQAA